MQSYICDNCYGGWNRLKTNLQSESSQSQKIRIDFEIEYFVG